MTTQHWVDWDRQHCWHPFTPQEEWTSPERPPLMIASGEGVWLTDTDGKRYLDGNASIWTNIHGHNHPRLNAAIQAQLEKVAHTSYLGFGHPLASELSRRLCSYFPPQTLERCFFSDDGSTAVEVAMKMSLQSRMQSGMPEDEGRTAFICFQHAYHGDTMGAASLGGVSLFFDRFTKLGLPVHRVGSLAEVQALSDRVLAGVTALIIEPLIQGVNQMTPWPAGMLAELRAWCVTHGIHLILDEVMTGFGRTGSLFACQQEEVVPDFLCLAKGLTAGYLPMAATLTTEEIYTTFLGRREHAFYYGHSYTANPIGCAVALASLDLMEEQQVLAGVREKAAYLSGLMAQDLAPLPLVFDIRQVGLVVGLELRQYNGAPFPASQRLGARFCEVLKAQGVLTRPILDTIVYLPPLSITAEELRFMVRAFQRATLMVQEELGRENRAAE